MSALRDIPFQELFNQTAEHCGLDSERLAMSEGRGLATFLTTAAREMLRENDWPGSIVTETRFIDAGAAYVVTSAYAYAAVVRQTIGGMTSYWQANTPFDDLPPDLSVGVVIGSAPSLYTVEIENRPRIGDTVYASALELATVIAMYPEGSDTVIVTSQNLAAATISATLHRFLTPSEMPEDWQPYAGPLRIAYEQTGKTPILDVLAVYSEDPATTDSPSDLSYTLDETGILLDAGSPGDIWVQFRKPPPRFTIAPYDAARAYLAGELVVAWPNAYLCIQGGTAQTPASSPTFWQAQTLPEKVSESVCLDSAIRWLRSQNRHAEANALRTDREDALDRASRVRNRQEGQTRTYGVATRNNAAANNYRPRRAALR